MRSAPHVGRLADPYALTLAFAFALSGACGALLAGDPRDLVLVFLLAAAVSLALLRPATLFMFSLALLALEPTKVLHDGSALGRPETVKLFLYASTLPLLFSRGVDRRKLGPLIAYGTVTALAATFGTQLAGLTYSQTFASLATLALGWVVFAIRWDWRRDKRLLKAFTLIPTLSILLGVALQDAGRVDVFRHTSPPRLEGATIPPWLATISLCAVLACLLLARREHWRWAKWLGVLDGAILAATLTRGALLALAILLLPSLVGFWRRESRRRGAVGLARLAALLATAVLGGVLLLLPGLQARDEHASVLIAGRGSHEIASGRFQAWSFAYERAKVNLAFGRGVGAGPIVGKTTGGPTGFFAQHNEYLRMLLEVGVVGAVILLLTIACTLVGVIARAPSLVRPQLTAAALALSVYSVTENTLSATPLAVALLLVFSLGASVTREAARPSSPRPYA